MGGRRRARAIGVAALALLVAAIVLTAARAREDKLADGVKVGTPVSAQ